MTAVLGILAALAALAGAGARALGREQAASAAPGYAALLLAAALARSTIPVPQLPVFLLLGFAVARLVLPSFPDGPLRIGAAAASYGTLAAAAVVLPGRVGWWHALLVVLGWIVVAAAVASIAAPWAGERRLELAFEAVAIVWLVVVALHFATHTATTVTPVAAQGERYEQRQPA